MQAWRRLIRDNDLFVDVGANVGLYTLWAASCGAEIIAVEPVEATREELIHNITLNGLEERVQVEGVALMESRGHVRMSTDRDTANVIRTSGLRVPATTLDELISGRHVRGAKIDVEGAEQLVINGAIDALSEHRLDVLQIEWNRQSERNFGTDRDAVAAILKDYGYRFFRPDELGSLNPSTPVGYGTDLFAVSPLYTDELQAYDTK